MSHFDLRQSQLITTSGVGSIIDFPNDSLMLVGLDFWPFEMVSPRFRDEFIRKYGIRDSRLQRRVNKRHDKQIDFFLKPTEAPPPSGIQNIEEAHLFSAMPFIRFPTWYWCPRCHLLHQLDSRIPNYDDALYCEGQFSWTKKPNCKERPTRKGRKKGRVRLIPARFLVACEAGHIDDFPYARFLHHGQQSSCQAAGGSIFLISTGGMGLGGIKLKCAVCRVEQPMIKAIGGNRLLADVLGGKCPGTKPWLPDSKLDENCSAAPRMVEKGSTNIYFNCSERAIFIPDKNRQLEEALMIPDYEADVLEAYDAKTSTFDVRTLRFLERRTKFSQEDIKKYLLDRQKGKKQELIDDTHFLKEEYDAFLNKIYSKYDNKKDVKDFNLKEINIIKYERDFGDYFDRVVLLQKLRETRVFTGFTRLSQEAQSPAICEKKLNWLPAIEVRGEGIFLRLNAERLHEWDRKIRAEDYRRLQHLTASVHSHQFVMIHTLAHLLIRQLSFECGYGSTSLSERLYVGKGRGWEMHGLLIYTASGDSEGTMGGLVRQGQPGRLESCLDSALKRAEFCSNDPLCMESRGQGFKNRNLAACHACALVPETACECGNQFLDRALVIGGPPGGAPGYFAMNFT